MADFGRLSLLSIYRYSSFVVVVAPSIGDFIDRVVFKVEALWFGCYGVIIWFLSGKNQSECFLLFSLSDIFFALFVRAIFCVRFTQIYYYHVTKELCAWLITRYTFHAHCCVVYQRAVVQDADVFWEDENFIKFPSKIDRFCHFLWKVVRQPHFFYFAILKYLR